ncbi:MAG: CDP-diacylglycerol--glycerol-3-phosphate 3-phosphatidyltransferase [Clostridia bacterium]|nr:CDP-diacylglycerol--glycerol-3-phosphate 3-phosphatidyltransferase [Clostridia bacterium]
MNKNVPNILTMIRIAFTPLIILMFLLPIDGGVGVFVALGLYVLGCFTDFLDGKIARKYNLISDFGKFMDQIADKFITTTAMILVLFSGYILPSLKWINILMVLVVVLRDILVSGIRMYAASKGTVIAADIFGKIKSFFLDVGSMILMLTIGLMQCLTITKANVNLIQIFAYVGIGVLGVGVVLSLLSCVNYSIKGYQAIKKANEGKSE